MLLDQLPQELLLHILRFLGPAFFCQDIRRLLVSRWWHQLARPVLLQDLDFSEESLKRFVLAPDRDVVIRSIENHVTNVSLGLDGFRDWDSAQPRPGTTGLPRVDLQVLGAWTSELNHNLAELAAILQRCTKLKSLRLEARPERHDPQAGLERRYYLMAFPVASIVTNGQLTCLELDTAGTGLIDGILHPKIHLCNSINSMLPTLRRLRCRMTKVCPHILGAPADRRLLRLKDVVINLSLSEISDSDTSYRYPRRCGHIAGDSFARLKAEMEHKATEVARRMSDPRTLRIVSHTFPALKIHSFDALTGRRMLLVNAAPWDADGEEVEERPADEEVEESDSDSSSDEGFL